MKKIALVISLVLIICSLAGIFLEARYRNDLRLQRLFARFFVLADQRVLEAAHALREKATPESLREALVLYREVVSRDPENPYRWCELGLALLDSGKIDEARQCYRRAAELGPNNIQTLWRVAQFYQRTDEPREVFRYASHMLEKDPSVAEDVFYLYSDFDFPETLSRGIPQNRAMAQAYLRYLVRNSETEKAEQCWSWVAVHSFADDKLAGEYVSFLISAGAPAKAQNAWFSYTGQHSLVYNGGFELGPKPSPFDWRISETAGAEVSRDTAVRHEGKCSLRIEFDGKENLVYRHVAQSVFLGPGTYSLGAFMRAEGITTEQGIGLRLGSAATDRITGTTDWKELSQTIKVSQPSLLRLEVFRNKSWRIANQLSGTVWLDDVSLTRQTSGETE